MFPASKPYHKSAASHERNCAFPEKNTCKKGAKCRPLTYTLGRFAAGSTAALPRRVRHSCHATSIGAAMAIEEYVPIRIPTTSAKEKPFSTWPPKINKDSTVRKVSPEVST